jgi:hypothetical protein
VHQAVNRARPKQEKKKKNERKKESKKYRTNYIHTKGAQILILLAEKH